MKTLFPIIAVVLLPLAPVRSAVPFPPTTPRPGQPVYDSNADSDLQQVDTDLNTFKTAFDAAMTLANTALGKIQTDSDNTSKDMDAMTAALQGLQKVVGDPSLITSASGAPTASSVQALETDFSKFNTKDSNNNPITFSTDPLKHFNQDFNDVPSQEPEMASTNQQNTLDNLVYKGTAGGLYTAIGPSYTPMKSPDPNNAGKFITDPTATRGSVGAGLVPNSGPNSGVTSDGVSYLPEASELVAVNDYFNVRDAALTRREGLQKALTDAVNALDNAPDFATVKIAALIQALQSQMQACDNDVLIAFNDLAARGMQVYVMNSVQGKASGEAATALMLASQNAANALTAPGTTPPTSNSGSPSSISNYTPAQTAAPAGATAATGYSTNGFPWTVYQ